MIHDVSTCIFPYKQMLGINPYKRYRTQFKRKAHKSNDRLPTWPISSCNGMHFQPVSSTNQLNTCLEMNGIHYLSFTLKVSQLTFKVIVQKKGHSSGGKTFPLSRATSLDVWNFSFGVDRVLLEAEQHHSGTALWLWLLSLIFSLFSANTPPYLLT